MTEQAALASQGLPVRVMFQEEARFGRLSDPRRCWAPPGVRPEVSPQVVQEYEYAFAAASPHDGTLDSLVLPAVPAEAMSVFLAEVSQRHPGEWIVMALDGAGTRRSAYNCRRRCAWCSCHRGVRNSIRLSMSGTRCARNGLAMLAPE